MNMIEVLKLLPCEEIPVSVLFPYFKKELPRHSHKYRMTSLKSNLYRTSYWKCKLKYSGLKSLNRRIGKRTRCSVCGKELGAQSVFVTSEDLRRVFHYSCFPKYGLDGSHREIITVTDIEDASASEMSRKKTRALTAAAAGGLGPMGLSSGFQFGMSSGTGSGMGASGGSSGVSSIGIMGIGGSSVSLNPFESVPAVESTASASGGAAAAVTESNLIDMDGMFVPYYGSADGGFGMGTASVGSASVASAASDAHSGAVPKNPMGVDLSGLSASLKPYGASASSGSADKGKGSTNPFDDDYSSPF